MIDLKNVINNYPDSLSSGKKLKSVLLDLYPDEKLYGNILSLILDDGIVDEIKNNGKIDVIEFVNICNKLEQKHGISHKYIEGCLTLWAIAFDIPLKTRIEPIAQIDTSSTFKETTIHTHKYTDTIIPPTCVEKGYTLHACDCGYEYKDNYVNAKHDYVLIEYIAPTCETDGRESYKCIHCGKEKIEIIKATGHTFGNWIEQKKPSCTICGCEARECSVCGKVERRSIAQTGHKFSSWRKEGSDYVRDCHNCGFEQKIGFPVEEEGQIIEFGRFLQKDGSMSPIKWIVLKIDNNKKRALVFSLVTIAERMYNKTILRNTAFLDENDASEKLAWKNSDIRIWLNNDFFNFAFTASEKSIILESQNHNHIYKTNEYRSKEYEVVSVKEGPITTDNVFLLSISEIETCFHWSFKRRQLPNVNGENFANYLSIKKSAGWGLMAGWGPRPDNEMLLRDLVFEKYHYIYDTLNFGPMCVSKAGRIYCWSEYCGNERIYAIRPAMWIDLSNTEEKNRKLEEEQERRRLEERRRADQVQFEREQAIKIAEKKRKEEAIKKERREKGVCQHCGGQFKGFLTRKCICCGKKKDY